jgi:poly(3-hydroxybutyrate) depolymerase
MFLSSCATQNVYKNITSNYVSTNYSAGCDIAQTGANKFMPVQIAIQDQARTYHLRVPANYNPEHAYPLIFLYHGYGGNGLSGGLNIERHANDKAIIASADGLDKAWDDSTNENDLLLFDNMLETISTHYCIDRNRIFSYGFSMGGYFTNLLACERGDILRASAAIASWPRGNHCKGKVAAWFMHDSDDDAIKISLGQAARDKAIVINGCSHEFIVDKNGCNQYQNCQTTPVVWCQTSGHRHNIRGDVAPGLVWQFFQSFN